MPCADRNHSSFLYTLGESAVLLDCGEPVCRSYKNSGLSWELIDQIVLSHFHFDHVGGFFMFMQGMWLEKRQKPLPVAMPADGLDPVRRLLETGMLFDELLPFKLSCQALKPAEPFQAGGIRVTPFATTHLAGLRRQFGKAHPLAFEAFCFLLEGGGFRVGHSADLGTPADLEPLLEKPLDLLLCELAHFHPEDLFTLLSKARIGHLVLTHLGRPQQKRHAEIQRNAARILPGWRITFARDYDVIAL